MDGMVDENGAPATDPLAPSPDPPIVSSVRLSDTSQPHLVTATNIVHLTLPTHTTAQVQSVIQQPNQQSVIQTATNLQQVQCKGNVILLGKPNSVIQTAQGSLQTLQVVETGSDDDDSCYSEDESPKKRRDLLTRRPSYRKILNELGGGEIAVDNRAAVAAAASSVVGVNRNGPAHILTSSSGAPISAAARHHHLANINNNNNNTTTMVFAASTKVEQTSSEGDSELDEGSLSLTAHSIPYHTVIPAGAIQISSGEGGQGIHTLTMTNSGASGAIVQYAQGQEFFVPVVAQSGSGGGGGEDQSRKREMRLLKNREAARECRRKKKEYIKCLENRVAVLENQNKALIDELKTLKELYCQQKVE